MTDQPSLKRGRKPVMSPDARAIPVTMEPTMLRDLDEMAREQTEANRNALIRKVLAGAIDDWKRQRAAAVVAP